MYLSTREIAHKWGIDQSRVLRLAREGRIEGAVLFGNNWLFPHDVKKPEDRRKKSAKARRKPEITFRFPSFVNFKEDAFFPPLSDEENQLRLAQKDFYACRFDEAKETIIALSEKAENRNVRIYALYLRRYLDIYDYNIKEFESSSKKFTLAFLEDFPYKREMLLLRYKSELNVLHYKNLLSDIHNNPEYAYHPSVYNELVIFSLISLGNGDFSLYSRLRLEAFDLHCLQMEHDGYFLEAQELHYLLLIFSKMSKNKDIALFHLRRGLEIAIERELYFYPAVNYHYFMDDTNKMLADFPREFADKIRSLGTDIHKMYLYFSNSHDNAPYLSIINDEEYMYIAFAVQGYTNREIAAHQGISEKTVYNYYSRIYNKFAVKSKSELVELINTVQRD